MNTRILAALIIFALALSLQTVVAADKSAASTELDALIAKIRTKLSGEPVTEADLAPELKEFDALLAKHKDEKTDDLAQILLMKAVVYRQVKEDAKGDALMAQLLKDFPDSKQAKMMKQQEAAKKLRTSLVDGAKLPDFEVEDTAGSPAQRQVQAGARKANQFSAQEPTRGASNAWTNDMTLFVKGISDCIKRCPTYSPELENNSLVTKFTISRDGRPIFQIFDGLVGTTTQGEINKYIGDGRFQWIAPVGRTQSSQQHKGKVMVFVDLPSVAMPQGWQLYSQELGLYAEQSQIDDLKIKAGSKIRFQGSFQKKADDFVMSGATAFHGVGIMAGTNTVRLTLDTDDTKLLGVEKEAK
jgi:hypothetical protein